MRKLIVIFIFAIIAFIKSDYLQADPIRYEGTIGDYAIKMTLYYDGDDCRQGFGCVTYYRGSYTYKKAGNTLSLKGFDWTMTSKTTLEEYTKSGKHSATWDLEGFVEDKILKGKFTNLTNGKKYKVFLHLIN